MCTLLFRSFVPPPRLLREQDLNLRPLGYEPNELPTALPRPAKVQLFFHIAKSIPLNVAMPNTYISILFREDAVIYPKPFIACNWWYNYLRCLLLASRTLCFMDIC